MKIFISIPWFHPAYKAGGPIRSIANMVQQMDNGDHQFRIFCSNKDHDGTMLESVPHDKWVQYNANTKVWYNSGHKTTGILRKEVNRTKPDLFFIIGLYDWEYNFDPLLHFKKIKKVISVRGMLHPGALSQKKIKKKIYLQAWKMMGIHKKNFFHASDEAEKKYIHKVFGKKARVMVAGNFPSLYAPAKLPAKQAGVLKMISIGLIGPMKNHLQVLEALMEDSWQFATDSYQYGSLQLVPNIEYNIYGPVKDDKYWSACVELVKKVPANIKVQYHGEIAPAEIATVLSRHHLFILPSKSENYGHAIIEALSAGLPVITSEATPWNGLQEAKAGININPENPEDIKTAIGFFLGMDKPELQEWSRNANLYALEKVDVESTKRQYEEMFRC